MQGKYFDKTSNQQFFTTFAIYRVILFSVKLLNRYVSNVSKEVSSYLCLKKSKTRLTHCMFVLGIICLLFIFNFLSVFNSYNASKVFYLLDEPSKVLERN